MGVTGLWRLIEPAGKPVPVETLENKVLAVDISIWLHQVVKGYQDARGAPLPNAHLMGLFQRLCKLLYFRIKPVFVFDGGYPELKKETIAKRQDDKIKYNSESERLKRELVLLLSKKTAIGSILGKQISPKKAHHPNAGPSDEQEDLFKLPALPERNESESESDDEDTSSSSIVDLHSVDIESNSFKNMPVKDKYELLIELKETRKMNSWGRLHELPKKSDNFSDFQINRLLKRRKVQECLEETEKEMGGVCMSLNELESLLNEEGIDTKMDHFPSHRIASSDNQRFLLIKDVKKAMEDAKKHQEHLEKEALDLEKPSCSKQDIQNNVSNNSELDEDLKKAIAMSLECSDDVTTSIDEPSTSMSKSSISESGDSTCLLDSDYSDTDEEEVLASDMSSAKAYIMQFSDFTNKAIDQIIKTKSSVNKNKEQTSKVDDILKQLNEEKSIIIDKIILSSSEGEVDKSELKDKVLNSTIKDQNTSSDVIECDTSSSSIAFIESLAPEIVELDNSVGDNSSSQHGSPIIETAKQTVLLEQTPKSPGDSGKRANEPSTIESNTEIVQNPSFIVEHDVNSDEELTKNSTTEQNQPPQDLEQDADSSDEEFEEVQDNESNTKPVIELNLNMGEEMLDDDIFADIFTHGENCELKVPPSNVNSDSESNNIVQNAIQDDNKYKNTRPTIINTESEDAVTIKPSINQELTENDLAMVSNNKDKPKQIFSETELNSMSESLQVAQDNLLKEKGRLDRMSRNITDQMTKEVQELLQIFGIPYIVAPMEAEAQCAFLESVKLTDGTITDDSDIWLFGGETVYKNFFNQKKHVLQFLSERIQKSFNLSREKLVLLALLVGSDYTTGVTGIGPVTALEILASFPYNQKDFSVDAPRHVRYEHLISGLKEFKNWVKAGRRTDNTILKKKLRNVDVANEFPSARVVQAYFEPKIEKSKDKFSWGDIDLTVLRDYTRSKFGWSQSKLDEILAPVVKRLLERKNQKTLQDYFKRKIEFQDLEPQMSKRVKAAVHKMGPDGNADINPDTIAAASSTKPKTKRKRKALVKKNNEGTEDIKETNDVETNTLNIKSSDVAANKKTSMFRKLPAVTECKNPATSSIDITVPKLDRYQEIIPQREKDREHVLQNKMKAIEVFRKSKIDKKLKRPKRRVNLPKEKADLSESDTD